MAFDRCLIKDYLLTYLLTFRPTSFPPSDGDRLNFFLHGIKVLSTWERSRPIIYFLL